LSWTRPRQEAKSIVIAAEGEAASAELLNKAMEGNPAYLELRRIEVAKDVSDVISKSANRVYVSSDNLLMGLGAEASNKLFGAGK
jgi:prohibitin 2